ncbi:hypothetical protein FPOAC2_14246 [Fusarium poae]
MPALLQDRRHWDMPTICRRKRDLSGVIILPQLLKSLSVSAEDDGIVRKSTAMYDSRGKRIAPTSLHQPIGSALYAMLSTGGSDRYWSNSSCGDIAAAGCRLHCRP